MYASPGSSATASAAECASRLPGPITKLAKVWRVSIGSDFGCAGSAPAPAAPGSTKVIALSSGASRSRISSSRAA